MYIDDSGAELPGTVEPRADVNERDIAGSFEISPDGLDYTAIVETDDGSIAFTDTDADGEADLMTQLDADGAVIGRARFDEASGDWVQVDLEPDEPAVTVETTAGEVQLGPPTHDSDADGVNDTVVSQNADGDILIYTDADEDGTADIATEIAGDGRITVSEHTAEGDWVVIERGHLDEHGQYHRDDDVAAVEETGWISSGQQDATEIQGEVRVDHRTGHWRHD